MARSAETLPATHLVTADCLTPSRRAVSAWLPMIPMACLTASMLAVGVRGLDMGAKYAQSGFMSTTQSGFIKAHYLSVKSHSPFWGRLVLALERAGEPTSQVHVAKIMGIRPTAVNKWALGEGFPTTPRLALLATRLDVSVEWLLTGRGSIEVDGLKDSQLRRMLELWGELTDEQKMYMVQSAEAASRLAKPPKEEKDSRH